MGEMALTVTGGFQGEVAECDYGTGLSKHVYWYLFEG